MPTTDDRGVCTFMLTEVIDCFELVLGYVVYMYIILKCECIFTNQNAPLPCFKYA